MNSTHLISIVGAGPGDPELLTVKAYRRLTGADIILYDALLGGEILELAGAKALKIYAGKHCQDGQQQTERQDNINQQLKLYAREGKKVVRLKAGDPFIFGRGAEELQFCLSERLNVEVIPGITAGMAAASSFHIPVTLRGMNSMALFYTGHKRNGGFADISVAAEVLKTGAPVIVYMGLKNLIVLANQLLEAGLPIDIQVQIASLVGHKQQKLYSTNLGQVEVFLQQNYPPMPAVIILGKYAAEIVPGQLKGEPVFNSVICSGHLE